MTRLRLHVGTRDAVASEIIELIVEVARAAVAHRDVFALAVPGGSVAELCLPLLARAELPWPKVHIFWCDERAVPVGDRDSNAGLALKLWRGSPLAAAATLHIMPGDTVDLVQAADAYAAELQALLGEPPVFDTVLLGVGEDGHVASLFPEQETLHDVTHPVLAVFNSPKPPDRRLSLALPVLVAAHHTVIAAFGAGKARVMQQALEDPSSTLPVARVMQQGQQVRVMLDPEAASLLQRTS